MSAEPEPVSPQLLPQAITFTLPASGTAGDALLLEGAADSGLALTYRSDTPDRCAIDGTVLLLVAEGTCTVSAAQAGDDHHAPAAEMSASIEVIAPLSEPSAVAQEAVIPSSGPDPQLQAAASGLPMLYLSGSGQDEGDSGTSEIWFSAGLMPASSTDVTFNWATVDDSATAPSDYVAASGTVTITPYSSPHFIVAINGDNVIEPEERFRIIVSNVVGAVYDPEASYPYGDIRNDDGPPIIYLDGQGVTEGDGGTREVRFDVRQSIIRPAFSFDWTTVDDSATAPADYVAESGTITVQQGFCCPSFSVTVKGDTAVEPDERFRIKVSNVVGAVYDAGASDPYGWIRDDDPLALYLFGDSVDEGDGGSEWLWFEASLSRPSDTAVTFDWATVDDSATEPADYIAESGTVTFPAGGTYAEFLVLVNGDTDVEPNERFSIRVANVSGAATYDATASDPYGWIWDDDGSPELYLDGHGVDEGNSGTRELVFDAILSHPSSAAVTFDYVSTNDTATAPSDYVAESGSITIPAGSTSASISVTVKGDTAVEPDERFKISVSNLVGATYEADGSDPYGWIRDDDNPAPRLVLDGNWVYEGDPSFDGLLRTEELTFWAFLAHPSDTAVTFDYATVNDSATGGIFPDWGSDYLAESGKITIPAGLTQRRFTVTVIGDTEVEPDERFGIQVSNVVGASYDAEASDPHGEIRDDDDRTPSLTLDGYEVDEGNSGTRELRFRASLSNAAGTDVRVGWATVDDSATAPSDYVAESGTTTIPAGTTYAEFTVTVKGDTEVEFDEWFEILVSTVEGAVYDAWDSYPYGDILNDDLPRSRSTTSRSPRAPALTARPPSRSA